MAESIRARLPNRRASENFNLNCNAMQLVAEETGLVALVGDTYVQVALALAFDQGIA